MESQPAALVADPGRVINDQCGRLVGVIVTDTEDLRPAERVTHRQRSPTPRYLPRGSAPRTHGRVFVGRVSGIKRVVASDPQQHISMLRILYATCKTSLDAFRAADNPVDGEFVVELERITERTFQELKALEANSTGDN